MDRRRSQLVSRRRLDLSIFGSVHSSRRNRSDRCRGGRNFRTDVRNPQPSLLCCGAMAVPKPTLIPQQFAPDECQREAIEHVHGPMLVIAGAGTGKTTVLTRRIARLVRETMAQPGEILALTYTDNAAHEMRERVRSDLRGTDISQMQLATFHAYCNNLLIRSGKNFGVLDDKDLWIYLRRCIRV